MSARNVPPATITVYWCEKCERTTLFNPFDHYHMGKRCDGSSQAIKYRRGAPERKKP